MTKILNDNPLEDKQSEKNSLNLAGEYGVCAELSKRGIPCSLTYGNAKAADVIVFGMQERKTCYVVEVKTSKSTRFVTGFFQKYGDKNKQPHPDFWVIVYIDSELVSHYHILTHEEMGQVQMERNKMTEWEPAPKGCDNVLLQHIQQFEGKWYSIKDCLDKKSIQMDNFQATTILSEKITEKYGFRPGKSFSLVLQSAWWHGLGDKSSIDPKEIEDIAQSIFQQIDRGEID